MNDDATINFETDDEEMFAPSGYELVIHDGNSAVRFPICRSQVQLGGPGQRQVQIALDSPSISNRQAVFHLRQGTLFFTNLEPSLPAYLNGAPTTFSPLADGDELTLLHYHLRVLHVETKLATLEGCTEPFRGQVWGVGEEPVTIGRGSGVRPNLVDLADRTVSRAHATITWEDGVFWISCDTTSSPLRLDGKPVEGKEKLCNGALLQLGQQLLRFRSNEVEKKRRELMSQEATILFSDVWNYSRFAEGRPLEEVILQMNEFYSGLGKVITSHNGVLMTFLGDAMMAVFGSEGESLDAPENAVKAALEMQRRLSELNEKWRDEGRPTLEAGIGINTGEVMVGDVGFTGKYEFAAMGDQTNLAARVEKLTRERGMKIIVTGSTRRQLGDGFLLKPLGTTQVKGREALVELFGVEGIA